MRRVSAFRLYKQITEQIASALAQGGVLSDSRNGLRADPDRIRRSRAGSDVTTGHGPLTLDRERQSWKSVVKNLYRDFQRFDTERELLRAIDRLIVDVSRDPGQTDDDLNKDVASKDIAGAFTQAAEILSEIYELPHAGTWYVYTGDELLALEASPAAAWAPGRLPASSAVDRLATSPASNSVGDGPVVLDPSDGLFAALPGMETILVQPIYPNVGELLAVLVFADHAPLVGSQLDEPELRGSVKGVAQQLCIAYSHWSRAEQEALTRELWDLFLSKQLGPTRCFEELVRVIPRFLPSFGPLKCEPPPEVQILVLDHLATLPYLTIRASTGSTESPLEKIDVSDSISGLLVEQSSEELPLFCDDPTKPSWKHRYKAYLGHAKAPIRTELAVRLNVEAEDQTKRLIGVLNIESGTKNAFNLHHRIAVLALAERLAPMVDVFEERIRHNTVMHQSVLSSTSNYLDSLASIFRHGVDTPLAALRLDLDLMKSLEAKLREYLPEAVDDNASPDDVESHLQPMDKAIGRLNDEQTQLREYVDNFVREISDFGVIGNLDLVGLVHETVTLARASFLAKNELDISIEVKAPTDAHAFSARLFKQHLFSLMTNAIYAVEARLKSRPSPAGKILITIEHDRTVRKKQEIDLNKRWLVHVRDNGIGLSREDLGKLRQFKEGQRFQKDRPGHGFGLLAVQRFMGSIGGWIELDSIEGEWFQATLRMDEYREDIHGPLSTTTLNHEIEPRT
jgi:signal transduction histidine kinase